MDKVIVTGTGRCGTSFLMHLFTKIGLNTGFTKSEADEQMTRIDGLNAGIEHALGGSRIDKAEIIKNPEFIRLDKFVPLSQKYNIRHVIIPIRGLLQTAQSRKHMQGVTHGGYGGFWLKAENLNDQVYAHSMHMYSFMEHLTKEDIPFTMIHFDKMMSDPNYLHSKLSKLLDIKFTYFKHHYENTVRPDFIRF